MYIYIYICRLFEPCCYGYYTHCKTGVFNEKVTCVNVSNFSHG